MTTNRGSAGLVQVNERQQVPGQKESGFVYLARSGRQGPIEVLDWDGLSGDGLPLND